MSPGERRDPDHATFEVAQRGWRLLGALSRHPAASRVAGWLAPAVGPLELGLLGRTMLLAAAVGAATGLVGVAFVKALESATHVALDGWAGMEVIGAVGEGPGGPRSAPRLWVIAFLPALGALVSGLLTRLAPETAGGGADQAIEAIHKRGGYLRVRVVPLKFLASLATLVTGGAGGREGPTFLLGGAAGSIAARLLPASARERRLLVVAGLAAGISAVFRTPLGAALLAVEVLYRDDFETDALVPAIIASVASFSLASWFLGARPLFGSLPPHVFQASHLPLYALLAVLCAAAGALLVGTLDAVRAAVARLPGPAWLRPAAGGLALGVAVVALHLAGLSRLGGVPAESALLGGGYGVAQVALIDPPGSAWAWAGAMLLLAALRVLATGLTVGSGGSAGDFAPSLVIGALVGAAVGTAAKTFTGDPSIHPGAFALVGMATLYGGVAHVPLSAVVIVSELAGSYDLLVPLMLSAGAAHAVLRRVRIYHAQRPSRRRSWGERPSGVGPLVRDAVRLLRVETVTPETSGDAVRRMAAAGRQATIPVVDREGRYRGLIGTGILLALDAESITDPVLAHDLAAAPVAVDLDTPLSEASRRMMETGFPEIPVRDGDVLVGLLSQADVIRIGLAGDAEQEHGD